MKSFLLAIFFSLTSMESFATSGAFQNPCQADVKTLLTCEGLSNQNEKVIATLKVITELNSSCGKYRGDRHTEFVADFINAPSLCTSAFFRAEVKGILPLTQGEFVLQKENKNSYGCDEVIQFATYNQRRNLNFQYVVRNIRTQKIEKRTGSLQCR